MMGDGDGDGERAAAVAAQVELLLVRVRFLEARHPGALVRACFGLRASR